MKKVNDVPDKDYEPAPGVTDSPFEVEFRWGNEVITITLKNGRDVLRLAEVYKKLLDDLGIEYEETYHEQKKSE